MEAAEVFHALSLVVPLALLTNCFVMTLLLTRNHAVGTNLIAFLHDCLTLSEEQRYRRQVHSTCRQCSVVSLKQRRSKKSRGHVLDTSRSTISVTGDQGNVAPHDHSAGCDDDLECTYR
jgi:hypothetical protein